MTSPTPTRDLRPVKRTAVLFVCQANVCRSPAMHFFTDHFIRAENSEPRWRFLTAGVSAVRDEPMCESNTATLGKLEGGAEFAEAHRAKRLDARVVRTAGLILVASTEERSALTRIDPDTRSRTFTMIEAGRLLDVAHRTADSSAPMIPAGMTLDGIAATLHRMRGVDPLRDEVSRWRRTVSRGSGPTALDIADVHTGKARGHASMVSDVRWASLRLARVLGKTTTV